MESDWETESVGETPENIVDLNEWKLNKLKLIRVLKSIEEEPPVSSELMNAETCTNLQNLNETHTEQMRNSNETHAEQMRNSNETHAEQMRNSNETHAEQLQNSNETHAEQIRYSKTHNSNETCTEQMQNSNETHAEQIRYSNKTHAEQMQNSNETHAEQLQNSNETHAEQMQNSNETHAEQMQNSNGKYWDETSDGSIKFNESEDEEETKVKLTNTQQQVMDFVKDEKNVYFHGLRCSGKTTLYNCIKKYLTEIGLDFIETKLTFTDSYKLLIDGKYSVVMGNDTDIIWEYIDDHRRVELEQVLYIENDFVEKWEPEVIKEKSYLERIKELN